MAVCSLTATAQERSDTLHAPRMRFVEPRMPLLTAEDDSLHLPLLNQYGQVRPIGMYPYLWSGFDSWDLHRGLNVSMGASVFSSFGKHARGGTGFAQNVALMYAMPLTDKLSLSVGGYYSHFNYGRQSFHDAGLNAVLGYQFNEHWEAFLYGQKSIVENRFIPYPLYDMGDLGDRIGVSFRYNVTPSFRLEMSIQQSSMPHPPLFHDAGMQPPHGRR